MGQKPSDWRQNLKTAFKASFKAYLEQYALSPDWREKYDKKLKWALIFLLILIVFISINHSFIVASGLYFFILLIGLMILVLGVRASLNRSIWRVDKPGGFILLITLVGVVGVTLLLVINVPNVISHLTQEDHYVAPTPQGFVPRLPGTPLPSCTGTSCSAMQVFDEYCNSLTSQPVEKVI